MILHARRRPWQTFYEMIKAEPDAPAMVIERDRKQEGHDEEHPDHQLIVAGDDWQRNEVGEDYHEFRGNDSDHDRSDKKSLLTFEDHAANIATLLYLEQMLKDSRATACRAAKAETPEQGLSNWRPILFQEF